MLMKKLASFESGSSWSLGTRSASITEARVKALMTTRGPSAKTMRTQPGGVSVWSRGSVEDELAHSPHCEEGGYL